MCADRVGIVVESELCRFQVELVSLVIEVVEVVVLVCRTVCVVAVVHVDVAAEVDRTDAPHGCGRRGRRGDRGSRGVRRGGWGWSGWGLRSRYDGKEHQSSCHTLQHALRFEIHSFSSSMKVACSLCSGETPGHRRLGFPLTLRRPFKGAGEYLSPG